MFYKTVPIVAAGMALLLVACGDQRAVPPLALDDAPPVSAEFRTTLTFPWGEQSRVNWRFWRNRDRIERENLAARSGEVWVQDGKTLFHTRLYHMDKRGIEYRNEDLQMLNAEPAWISLATLLDPRVIKALREDDGGWRHGYPYRRYTGKVDNAHWDVTVRTDRMLPVRIERRVVNGWVETVELLRSYEAGKTPWQPPNSSDYDLLDYADLGDHERDPFVMRIQASEGAGHVHDHGH